MLYTVWVQATDFATGPSFSPQTSLENVSPEVTEMALLQNHWEIQFVDFFQFSQMFLSESCI